MHMKKHTSRPSAFKTAHLPARSQGETNNRSSTPVGVAAGEEIEIEDHDLSDPCFNQCSRTNVNRRQLRPVQVPVIRTQRLAGYSPLREALDLHALVNRNPSPTGLPVAYCSRRHSEVIRQNRASSYQSRSRIQRMLHVEKE